MQAKCSLETGWKIEETNLHFLSRKHDYSFWKTCLEHHIGKNFGLSNLFFRDTIYALQLVFYESIQCFFSMCRFHDVNGPRKNGLQTLLIECWCLANLFCVLLQERQGEWFHFKTINCLRWGYFLGTKHSICVKWRIIFHHMKD